ncbi:hypothetical protein ACFW9O_06745 [Streptomyces sp. NPDC059499]|uniref:hypothetical protein n=1 Tax=Streptomyces sp. NPDC059499 TaxID=3346852 RepID=UPI003689C386
MFRAELAVTHVGLAITIVASVFVGGAAWSPRADAARAAYTFTFGWAEWIMP